MDVSPCWKTELPAHSPDPYPISMLSLHTTHKMTYHTLGTRKPGLMSWSLVHLCRRIILMFWRNSPMHSPCINEWIKFKVIDKVKTTVLCYKSLIFQSRFTPKYISQLSTWYVTMWWTRWILKVSYGAPNNTWNCCIFATDSQLLSLLKIKYDHIDFRGYILKGK